MYKRFTRALGLSRIRLQPKAPNTDEASLSGITKLIEEKPKVFKDIYVVNPPFGSVGVEIVEGKHRYVVIEPPLNNSEAQLLKKIKDTLLEEIDLPLEALENESMIKEYLEKQVKQVIKDRKLKIPDGNVGKFLFYVLRDFLGYGKIDVLMRDPNVEDISVDGVDSPVYVWHRTYEGIQTNICFEKDELASLLSRLAYKTGRQLTVSYPILDGVLPEGYRVHVVLEGVSKRGGSFTIRKFSENPFTIIDLINYGVLSPKIAAYFWVLIENYRSIMVEGVTGAGKTTLLNAISMFIHPEKKIVTIEETRELRLPHENWVPLMTRQVFQEGIQEITLFDLLKSALRQRPDYVIVGEVRGEEAYTLFQAISTGHGGLCSIHAESVDASIKRLMTKPMNVPPMLVPLMNVAAMVNRVKVHDAITRRITVIEEIVGVDKEKDVVTTNPVFLWTGEDKDSFSFSGRSIVLEKIARFKHVSIESLFQELEDRALVIKWMVERKLRSYCEVANIIRKFYYEREKVLRKAKLEVKIFEPKKLESTA